MIRLVKKGTRIQFIGECSIGHKFPDLVVVIEVSATTILGPSTQV
jgi:hypothetical protein